MHFLLFFFEISLVPNTNRSLSPRVRMEALLL